MYHFIYKTTHQNGKYYIGRHSTKNLNDGYFGSGKWIRSIKDQTFLKLHIIEYCENIEELKTKEKMYIQENIQIKQCMNFNNNSCGFATGELNPNSTPAGKDRLRLRGLTNNPMKGKKHKPETIEKLRISSTGRMMAPETKLKLSKSISISRKGLKYSDDGRKKLSESRKKQYLNGERNLPSFKGGKHKEESKNLIRQQALNRKYIVCVHCGNKAKPHTFKRWHGNNCKNRLEDNGTIQVNVV